MITTSNSPVKGSGIPNRMSSEGWCVQWEVKPHQDKSQSSCSLDSREEGNESLKSIDKAILGMVSESSGRNESERIGGLESRYPGGRALVGAKAAWIVATD